MNVALVTHNVLKGDGQGRVNYELTRYLLGQGVEVTLLADDIAPELVEKGADWQPVQLSEAERTAALFKVWGFAHRADRFLRRFGDRFDAILGCGVTLSVPHAINAVHFAYGGWRRSPYHSIRTDPGLWGAYQWIYTLLNDHWERQTLGNAERIVAVSEMVKTELVASGMSADKIDVIVNGVDVDHFRPGDASRSALGLPEDVPLALFVGDLRSPIKNPDGVLRAVADISDVHLAVAGSLEGSSLPSLAAELGIENRIHFLGFRRDVAELMRAADFFMLPSRRDSCPLVLLEAMASGLPAIVSRKVGTSHLVSDGAGFVLDAPDDHEAMARKIRLLAQRPESRRDMGRRARRVAKDHTWDKMADQYYTLLQEVALSPSLTE